MHPKLKHLLHVPFTGLGLYHGFRGNRWLRNRVKIFKQFVIPSLQAQTSQDFIVWFAFRREERNNPIVKELERYMATTGLDYVFTYAGICFYDDKYSETEARLRLIDSIHQSTAHLFDKIGECDYVLMTIQPSDDCYDRKAMEAIQKVFRETNLEGVGFPRGYIMNYQSKEVSEYNPNTNPPFYTIKFPRDTFFDPLKHYAFTALKKDVGKYKKGTACPSHEYVPDCVKYGTIDARGFLVGCHGENVSTYYDHPFKGKEIVNFIGGEGNHLAQMDKELVLKNFGLENVQPLKLKWSIRKWILKKMPHPVRRKLRYLWGEKVYNWIRA